MENQNNPEKQYGGTDLLAFSLSFPPLRKKTKRRVEKNENTQKGTQKTCSNFSFVVRNAMIVVYLLMTCCMLSFVL